MLMKLRRKKTAQSTLEYVVLFVIVLGALISVQAYLRAGIGGKFKDSTDQISLEQYDPAKTVYSKTTKTVSNTQERATYQGTTTNMLTPEQVTINAWSSTNRE